MKRIKLLSLAAIALSFASCNTIIGMGRDIRQGTQAIGGGIQKGGDSVGDGLENKGYGKPWNAKRDEAATAPAQ